MDDPDEVGAPIAPTIRLAEGFCDDDGDEVVQSPLPPPTPPFDPEPVRERVRSWLAGALVGLVVLLILGMAIAAAFGANVAIVKDLAGLLLTPAIGLTGAVLGFYFAIRR